MTINKVKEILNGTFADHADREYWERKLSDMERKAATAAENVFQSYGKMRQIVLHDYNRRRSPGG